MVSVAESLGVGLLVALGTWLVLARGGRRPREVLVPLASGAEPDGGGRTGALAGASSLRAHQTDWVATPASAVLAEVTSVVEDNGAVLQPGGCDLIRAEALIRLEGEPAGLLALGQRTVQPLDGRHGSELLLFLGRSLSAMIQRWINQI